MSNIEQCSRCLHDHYSCGCYDHTNEHLCQNYEKPLDNSKMFGRTLSKTGRIGRLEYLIVFILSLSFGFTLTVAVVNAFPSVALLSPFLIWMLSLAIWTIPCIFLVLAGIKRTNDASTLRWFAYMPVIGLFIGGIIMYVLLCVSGFFLFFVKGEDGINRHGSNPSQPYEEQLQF